MRDRIVMEAFEKYVPGADFIDIAPLWGTVNETMSVAARFHPKSISAADFQPLNVDSWIAMREHLKALGVTGVREYYANVDDKDLPEIIGTYDFVYSAGVLYHNPSPLYTLSQYHRVTRRHLLLGTTVVHPQIENEHGRLDFSGGQCVFVPALAPAERKILSAYYDGLGLKLQYINIEGEWPWRSSGMPNFGPWWWLYSADTCRRMIDVSGFKILDEESTMNGRYHFFLCERTD